jgi:hypothetical protein
MSEVLLETLVGAVTALEKKTKDIQDEIKALPDHSDFLRSTNSRLGAAEQEIKSLPEKVFMPLPEIIALTTALQKHSALLSVPMKQQVRHEYHLTKPVWACIVMFLVIIGLLFLEYYTWLEADLHKENDIKYRYLQVFETPEGKELLHNLDSQYTSDPDQFHKEVIQQEKIDRDRFDDFQRIKDKQEEVKGLQEKWDQQPGIKPK